MATIELVIPYGDFPNYLKYTNDNGTGTNRTEGGSSRSANYDGSGDPLSPKIRYITVNKVESLDFLSSNSVPSGGYVDDSPGRIEIKYGDRYLYLRDETFGAFMKIKAFIYGSDNNKKSNTVEVT